MLRRTAFHLLLALSLFACRTAPAMLFESDRVLVSMEPTRVSQDGKLRTLGPLVVVQQAPEPVEEVSWVIYEYDPLETPSESRQVHRRTILYLPNDNLRIEFGSTTVPADAYIRATLMIRYESGIVETIEYVDGGLQSVES